MHAKSIVEVDGQPFELEYGALAVALFIIIRSSIYWSSINTLLAEDGWAKSHDREMGNKLASVYWPIIVAIYLGYNFIKMDWGRS